LLCKYYLCQILHSEKDLRIKQIHSSLLEESPLPLTYIPHTFICLWSSISFLFYQTLSVSSFTNGKLDELVLIHVRKCGGTHRQADRIPPHLHTKPRRRYLEQEFLVCNEVMRDKSLKSKFWQSINTNYVVGWLSRPTLLTCAVYRPRQEFGIYAIECSVISVVLHSGIMLQMFFGDCVQFGQQLLTLR